MKQRLLLSLVTAAAAATAATAPGCSSQSGNVSLGPSTFAVTVTQVNGGPLPTVDAPLPSSHGLGVDTWSFEIEAHTPTGELATDFNGFVRPSVVPGAVVAVTGPGSLRNNILLQGGKASGTVQVTAQYGPTNLWIEDLGYVPAVGHTAACANGLDDNHNGLIDFPADPGCYYNDDDTEDGGTYAAGVSAAVQYALPQISDVRGGSRTPYQNEAVEIATNSPANLVVTRISSGGFYVTDLNPTEVAGGYNSLYAFNFSAPANMRICDRITYLSGTANDFFGFTQLSFPSFQNTYIVEGVDGGVIDVDGGVPGCQVPEPHVLAGNDFGGDKGSNLFKYESGLVRLQGFTIAKNFGQKLAFSQNFGPGQSNCDFNGDGQIDYTEVAPNCPTGQCEGDCATQCDGDANCSEWTSYSARNEYKVSLGGTMIQIDTSTVASFDPVANAGKTLPIVSGTLTEFSGGSLNWTVEVRCGDDLVCQPAGAMPSDVATGCTTQETIPSASACVRPRTIDDNDEGSD
jgi:hypothetical protein